MSDLSILSYEYKAASELFHTINHSLIKLKKVQEGLPGAAAIAPQDLEESRRNLAAVLSALAGLLKPKPPAQAPASGVCPRIPGALVARLREEQRGDLDCYVDDILAAAARLRRPSELTTKDRSLLDQLAAAADAGTSTIFQHMMRK